MKTLKELLLTQENQDHFGPEDLQRIEQILAEDHKSAMPWYLRIIPAIGAWLASIFFLGFVAVFLGFQEAHHTVLGVIGSVLLVIAVIIGRQRWGIFVSQCALAISLSAQPMIYIGFLPDHVTNGTIAAFSLFMALLLYFAYPDFLSRLITCFAALQITLFWLNTNQGDGLLSGGHPISPDLSPIVTPLYGLWFFGLQLQLIAWWCTCERRSNLVAPLGYAVALSLAAWDIENLCNVFDSYAIDDPVNVMLRYVKYMRLALVAVSILGMAIWSSGGASTLRRNIPIFFRLSLALAAFVWLGSDGVLLSLLFLVLGFLQQNKVILGLGLILLPVFLAHYYNNLNLDLLAKSCVLIASGMVLLLVRSGLTRWVFADLKEAA